MASAYTLAIGIRASTDKLRADMTNATKILETFGVSGKNIVRLRWGFEDAQKALGVFGLSLGKVAGIAAGVGAAAIFALTRAVHNAVEQFRQFVGVSTALGVSLNTMAKLEFAAQSTGVSFEQLRTAMLKSTKAMAEVAATGQDSTGIFRRLKMSSQAFLQLDPEKRFLALADAIQKIPREADRVRIAMQLFEEGGPQLLPLFSAGSQGIQNLERDAARLHLTFGIARKDVSNIDTLLSSVGNRFTGLFRNDAIQNMSNLSQSFGRLGSVFTGIGRSLAVAIGPFLTDLIEAVIPALVSAGQLLVDVARLLGNIGQSVLAPALDMIGTLAKLLIQVGRVVVLGITAALTPVLRVIEFVQKLPKWVLTRAGLIEGDSANRLSLPDSIRDGGGADTTGGQRLARDNFPTALLRGTVEAASKALQLEFGTRQDIPAQQLAEAVKTNQLLARMRKEAVGFAPAAI